MRLARHRAGYILGRYDGQAVYRVRKIIVHAELALDKFRPDCVVVQSTDAMPLARAVNDRGFRWWSIGMMCSRTATARQSELLASFCANSNFTASVYENLFGVKAVVIPPLIDRTLFEADCIGADCVTFVNPHSDKGAVLATEIAARCPDITFEFVELWMLDPATRRWLFRRLSELPNVRFTPRQSDMRPIYGRNQYSACAQSMCGGLGTRGVRSSRQRVSGRRIAARRPDRGDRPGGMLIDPAAPAEVWCKALRTLWRDKQCYAALSDAARRYSKRDDVSESALVDRMFAEIEAAIALRDAPREAAAQAATAGEFGDG